MPRKSGIWRRTGREGWYATIAGRQVCLGSDWAEAERRFHVLKSTKSKPASRKLVVELIDQYLDWAATQIKPITHLRYRQYLTSFAQLAGRIRASELSTAHVKSWLDAHPGWGQSSQHLALTILRIWAHWCESEEGIGLAAVGKVKRPRMRRRPPPAEGALEGVVEAIASPEFADYLAVVLDTGCRPGEIRTLEAAWIDWERSTAIVRGKTGPRLVGLTARASSNLRIWSERYPEGPVLRNSRGEPWSDGAVKHQMRRASIRSGKGRVVAYHCRHAYWARAVKAGVDSVVIAKQMGHSDLRMIMRHYSEADHIMLREAARKASPPDPEPPTSEQA